MLKCHIANRQQARKSCGICIFSVKFSGDTKTRLNLLGHVIMCFHWRIIPRSRRWICIARLFSRVDKMRWRIVRSISFQFDFISV